MKETVVEEEAHSDEEIGSGSDGFDDMEDIPLDVTQAAANPGPIPTTDSVKHLFFFNFYHVLIWIIIQTAGNKSAPAPSKKKSSNIMKPPTSQEMNALRETENLFHSNLFKLQVSCVLIMGAV